MKKLGLAIVGACALSLATASHIQAGNNKPSFAINQPNGPGQDLKGRGKTPNVLLLLTDDVGMDQLRLYGYGKGATSAPATPNLAELQKAGLLFRDAWTMPACSTSRGVLFTGRYPFRTELQAALGPSDLANSMISPWETTLPKLMSRAGYATALFGKFHIGLQDNNPYGLDMVHELGWNYYNGWLDETGDPSSIDTTAGLGDRYAGLYPNGYVPGSNVANGADSGACYNSDASCKPMSSLPGSRNPAGRACRDDGGIFVPNDACKSPMPPNLNFQTLSAHYVSPLVINDNGKVYAVPPTDKAARTFRNVQQTDAAIAWISAQQKRGKPWFATISTATVHTPMQVPPINTLSEGAEDPNGLTSATTGGKIVFANQMIQAMDHEFGRLLVSTGLGKKVGDRVVPTPDAANTVIIFVNDNGSLGSQVRGPFDPTRSKGTTYQTGIWTPMVIAGPAVKAAPNQEVKAMVNVADLYELIADIGGADVRKENPRRIDSVPMRPYLTNVNYPSIRKYDFSLVGPNLQANGGANGPCQFPGTNPPSCSQIPVTKGVCEDNGGTWFGEGNNGTYTTTSSSDPNATVTMSVPLDGFKYCCQVQQYIQQNGGVPGTVLPVTSIAVRDLKGHKLVRNQMNDYDPATMQCINNASYDELYVIDQKQPIPRIDTSGRLIPTPYSNREQAKYNELAKYMNNMLASEPDCLGKGDGNDDGVVDRQDLRNYENMVRLTSGSSWYDVNLDGTTNGADRDVIASHLGTRCR